MNPLLFSIPEDCLQQASVGYFRLMPNYEEAEELPRLHSTLNFRVPAMNNPLVKAGAKYFLAPYRPNAPGSKPYRHDVELASSSTTSGQSQQRRYFWQRKADPTEILTTHERLVLKKVKQRAHWLDSGFGCCCCRVGIDPLIGLIPVVGDFAGVLLALYIVQVSSRASLPQAVLSQMMMNIVMDFVVGLVPVLGDIMDFAFKCNTRNAVLLETYLYKRAHERIQQQDTTSHPKEPLLPATKVAIDIDPTHASSSTSV
ncbi:hypothetical protein BX666DRAFT_587960 [Dichotomocladium elegans]|nr:hypothetical protein BX666DRAFT_587960 [Dichotomocladium elegans]